MNLKKKQFDGVNMSKTKSKDYKIGKKKLSTKLKNIKMFEEFLNEKQWKLTLDLSDEFSKYQIDEIDENPEEFKKIKTAIYDKLNAAFEEVKKVLGEYEAGQYSDKLEILRDSSDAEEWDNNFNDLYDWADDNDVFIQS